MQQLFSWQFDISCEVGYSVAVLNSASNTTTSLVTTSDSHFLIVVPITGLFILMEMILGYTKHKYYKHATILVVIVSGLSLGAENSLNNHIRLQSANFQDELVSNSGGIGSSISSSPPPPSFLNQSPSHFLIWYYLGTNFVIHFFLSRLFNRYYINRGYSCVNYSRYDPCVVRSLIE